jgi:cytochrome c biogenesis protein CcmG/thiol:disulfide interchange protein DsbE
MKKASLLVMVFVVAAVTWTPSCSFLKDFKLSVKQQAGSSGKAVDRSKLPDEPQVTFKDLQGADVSLSSLKGKVVLVNFWATWCEPCLEEIPWMIDFQQKYASRGFTVLGVAMDDEGKSAVEPFVQKHRFDVGGQSMGMNYPIVLGNDDIGQKFGGLIGLPTSVLISRDGKIVKRFIGMPGRDLVSSEVEGLL